MKAAKKKRFQYLRSKKEPKVTEPTGNKESDSSVRVRKFSELQETGDFLKYVYGLPTTQKAIQDYSLTDSYTRRNDNVDEDGNFLPDYEVQRPRRSDLEFSADATNVGPATESVYELQDAYGRAGAALGAYDGVSLAEAKAAFDDKKGPEEYNTALENQMRPSNEDLPYKDLSPKLNARRNWNKLRNYYADVMGIDEKDSSGKVIRFHNEGWRYSDVSSPLNEMSYGPNPGVYTDKGLIKKLKGMYPNEPDETFESSEGIAKLMARRAGDRMSFSQNFDLVDERREGKYEGLVTKENPNTKKSSTWSIEAGSKSRPFTSGLGHIQMKGVPRIALAAGADKQTGAHEASHAGDFQTGSQARYISDNIDWDVHDSNKGEIGRGPSRDYIFEPSEVKARLMGVRYKMYHQSGKDPKDKYSLADVSNYDAQDDTDISRLRLLYSDETIAKLLNNVY